MRPFEKKSLCSLIIFFFFLNSFNIYSMGEKNTYLISDIYHTPNNPNENEVVKVAFNCGKALGLAVPRGRALYDYARDKVGERRSAVVYGYATVGRRKLTAKEVMAMSEEELYRTLKEADGSFLIVKLENEKVWIATDWLGTRPLYYAIINDGMVFSSCFWSVLRFLKEIKYPIKLDDTAILSYLWLGRIGVLGNRTFVEAISLAPPGTLIVYDLKSRKVRFHRYYQLQYKSEISDEKLKTIRRKL